MTLIQIGKLLNAIDKSKINSSLWQSFWNNGKFASLILENIKTLICEN